MDVQAQLPLEMGGLNGRTAYLCSGEGDFPIKRLVQLASVWEVRRFVQFRPSSLTLQQEKSGIPQHNLLDGVLIENMRSIDDESLVLVRNVTNTGFQVIILMFFVPGSSIATINQRTKCETRDT